VKTLDNSLVIFDRRQTTVENRRGGRSPPTTVNSSVRTREYLTTAEIERLMAAARKSSRYGHRDATNAQGLPCAIRSDRVAGQDAIPDTSAHAAAWLRLCPSQRRPRHQGAAGLARAQKHSAHGALHRVRCHPEPGRQRRDRSEVVRDLAGLGGHLAIRRGRVLSRPAARGPRTSSSSSSSSSSSLGWNEPVTVTLTIPARSACCCEEVASQRGTMDRHIPIPHCATLPPINGRKL
jgi:hypothetical protein